ncbi:ribosomal protein S18-alanine N-acetyltransferase [Oscillospiraceae bacterium PP1C4]
MKITAMTMEHLSGVASLERQCFSQPWSERVLEAELQNPNGVFLTAMEDETLAGYVGMHRVLDEGYIANVAVDENYRRRGVATMLLEELLAFARQNKLGFLTLEVREGNIPAIAFYSKMGFREVGRRRGFYAHPTEDAILMTIFL